MARRRPSRDLSPRLMALRLAAAYAVVGGLWILFSDRLLDAMGLPIGIERNIASVKGVGYAVVTSVALYFLAAATLNRLAAAQAAVNEQDQRIRKAYVDVLDAVTGGKLVLMTAEELAQTRGSPLTPERFVANAEDLSAARASVRLAATGMIPGDEITPVLTAVGEALNNALQQAGAARIQVFVCGDAFQVVVTDTGPGIDFATLPRATLVSGFSTQQTLGMGFTIMLNICERVVIATGSEGTSVLLEFRYS